MDPRSPLQVLEFGQVASLRGRWFRAALIAASLTLIALVAAGCGGSEDSDGGGDARARFDRALGPDGIEKIESGNLGLSLRVHAEGGGESGSFTFGLSGPFQSGENGGADLQLAAESSFPGSEGSLDVGLVASDQNLFIDYGGTTYELGAAQLKRLEGSRGSQPTAGLGFREVCRMQLEQAGADPSLCDKLVPSTWVGGFSDEGTETVGGVATDHLRADIEVRKLVTDLFEIGKSAAARQGVPLSPFDPDQIADMVDRYVDRAEINAYPATGDGIPRKLGLDLSVDAGDTGRVDLTVEAAFENVNEPQTIEPPAGPVQPIEALARRLPPPFDRLIGCLLDAKSQAELQSCTAGAGSLGATGASGAPSVQ